MQNNNQPSVQLMDGMNTQKDTATRKEPARELWSMLPPEGRKILLDYATQSRSLRCPHISHHVEVECCLCMVCELQELAVAHSLGNLPCHPF
jgi:hypothetical protein